MTIRFGIVGMDSPHAVSFAELIDGGAPELGDVALAGAWANAPSADMPHSIERIDGFRAELAARGTPIFDSLEELATQCDALLLVAVDSRSHAQLFLDLLPFGLPIYVDTRFAAAVRDADYMLERARAAGVMALGGSPKRFAPAFVAAARGDVERIELSGPMPSAAPFTAIEWYGVHMVDLAIAALGPGCSSVESMAEESFRLEWTDGRAATITGSRTWGPRTTGVVHTGYERRPFEIFAGEELYVPLLQSIRSACRNGVPNVPPQELRDSVAVVEAVVVALREGSAVHL